jgi:hypothetical protein
VDALAKYIQAVKADRVVAALEKESFEAGKNCSRISLIRFLLR